METDIFSTASLKDVVVYLEIRAVLLYTSLFTAAHLATYQDLFSKRTKS